MMDTAQVVANSLPFVMAYLLQLLNVATPQLAENTLKLLCQGKVSLENEWRDLFIGFALHLYRQISFVSSTLLSTVSALALSLASGKPLFGVIASFVLLIELVLWLGRWQTLAVSEEQRPRRDKEMTYASLATTTLMLMVTFLARLGNPG
jgi:hypothetical protein